MVMKRVCLITALLVWKLNNQYVGRKCPSFSITVRKWWRVTFSLAVIQALDCLNLSGIITLMCSFLQTCSFGMIANIQNCDLAHGRIIVHVILYWTR